MLLIASSSIYRLVQFHPHFHSHKYICNCLAHVGEGPTRGPGGACGVLSHNGIVWFNNYNLYNFRCPRVTQLFHSPRADTTFFSCPKGPPCGGGDEDTLFLAVSSCHNIMFLHVVTQWNCLVWCCRTMELFGLVLSYNGIVWFNRYNFV